MNTVRGVKGAKPRVSSGNGDRSKADEEYLAARNRQITAKAQMAELELRARRREWIPARQAEADLSLILVALRQRILNIHRAWPRQLVGKDLPAITEALRSLEESLLNELRDSASTGKFQLALPLRLPRPQWGIRHRAKLVDHGHRYSRGRDLALGKCFWRGLSLLAIESCACGASCGFGACALSSVSAVAACLANWGGSRSSGISSPALK